MAQIRLDDDVYNRLKECADKDCRTVGEEIHYLLDNRVELSAVYELLKSSGSEKKDVKPSWVQEKPSENNYEFIEVQSDQKSQEVGELLCKMNDLKYKLRDEQIIQWCQKMAIDECWTEEETKIEADNHRSELERHLELVMEQLNKLGMHMV